MLSSSWAPPFLLLSNLDVESTIEGQIQLTLVPTHGDLKLKIAHESRFLGQVVNLFAKMFVDLFARASIVVQGILMGHNRLGRVRLTVRPFDILDSDTLC